jgi:hypothetical protein
MQPVPNLVVDRVENPVEGIPTRRRYICTGCGSFGTTRGSFSVNGLRKEEFYKDGSSG